MVQYRSAQNSKCNHPAGGKCLNCIGADEKKGEKDNKDEDKPKCNHGPGGRCLNCTNYNPKDKQ